MNIEKKLMDRSDSKCELCNSSNHLAVYNVHSSNASVDESIVICSKCSEQIENPEKMDINHWRCLNESMWTQVTAVQVMI